MQVGEGNQQNQEANLPPNQSRANQEPNQVQNQPLGAPTEEPLQPLDTLMEEPNQPPNLPKSKPLNLPNPIANPQQLNWSYFKPEFAGKAEEDVETHLLRT